MRVVLLGLKVLAGLIVLAAAYVVFALEVAHYVPWPSAYPRAHPGDPRLAKIQLFETRAKDEGDTFVLLYTGDGGWAAIDQGIADGLAKGGVPTVGYDALRYFIVRRTPQEAADDLAAVLRHYLPAWGKSKVILAGYSLGGGVLANVIPLLPPDLRARVSLVVFINGAGVGNLQFHPTDWLNRPHRERRPLAPVLAQFGGIPVTCIYSGQGHSVCETLPRELSTPIALQGDHHFNKTYGPIGQAILAAHRR